MKNLFKLDIIQKLRGQLNIATLASDSSKTLTQNSLYRITNPLTRVNEQVLNLTTYFEIIFKDDRQSIICNSLSEALIQWENN